MHIKTFIYSIAFSSHTTIEELSITMESLPKGIILEFNTDTLEAVRKEVNLDQTGRMKEAIDILEDWVEKQNHFTKKDFSRDYLERTLISTKGLVERAKTRLDKLCTFRTLMPNYFMFNDVEGIFEELRTIADQAHLPKMTAENYRVHLCNIFSEKGDSSTLFKYYRYSLMQIEYLCKYDYSSGIVFVLDIADVSLINILPAVNIIELRQIFTILMEGYGLRLKGVHFITLSKMVDTLVSMVKPVLGEKLSKRIHIHKSVDTLYDHVPRDILPIEYGGKERPLKTLTEDWFKVLSSKKHQDYLKVMNEIKTNESLRQTDKFNEEYIGTPGSFRALSVD